MVRATLPNAKPSPLYDIDHIYISSIRLSFFMPLYIIDIVAL